MTDFTSEDWQKVNRNDKTSGMSQKAVKAYRRENPGSKLQTAVTTKPSKLKKGSKDAKRRKSFCARMSGMKKARASSKTKNDPNSPINKALRRWNCESVEQLKNLLSETEHKVNFLREEQEMNEDLRKWFKEKWVRFNPQGKIMGPCARGDDSEGKPKCLPQKKAQSLGKKGRASAAARKRRQDPNPERRGKAINVNTKKKTNEEQVTEKWSEKYKKSINCNNPKGFSQKAHCQGRKKNESLDENNIGQQIGKAFDSIAGSARNGVLHRTALLAMQGRQSEGYSLLLNIIKDSDPSVQKHIMDQYKSIKPVMVNNKVADSSTLDKSKPHQDWIQNTWIPWVDSQLAKNINEDKRIPRKAGQPANSKKHSDLYTDENPKGTIQGLKFATGEDAKASVNKIRNSGKSHAHKIQAAVAMEQRAKAAGKTEAASIYRKFINSQKKKTDENKLDEACWKGYHKEGMKTMFGKKYPNCVKNKTNEEVNEENVSEEKDACYHKVKSRYKVWPSAYASGALVKCRKVGASNWGNKSESINEDDNKQKQQYIEKLLSLDKTLERNYLELATIDELKLLLKNRSKKDTENVPEGQIYSGGGMQTGMRWYKPRTVPNQDELLKKESAIMKGLQTEGDKEFHTGGGKGLPSPSTYEQETLPYRTKGQRRTQAIAFEDENLDEYSVDKLEKYAKEAQKDMARQAALAKLARIEHHDDEAEEHERKSHKREKGLSRAERLAKLATHEDKKQNKED